MKKVGKNCFDEQEKSWTYLKMFLKKHKNSKAIWAVNLKFSPSANHGGQNFFKTLATNLF